VVNGKAYVTVGEKTFPLERNESTYIPIGEVHRLENREKEDLILIEAQVGTYLGEDDIVRLVDDYKRV
jgi:mannose-1-phosphate guanylyltransferase